jgi:GxxExxY protein
MNTDEDIRPPLGLRYDEVTDQILGIFYKVYNELGHGFLESVYARAMAIALQQAGLSIEAESPVPVWFRGIDIGNFRADFVVEKKILLELKAVDHLDRHHEAQLFNYLRATDIEVGLLLNFGPRPDFRRIVLDNDRKQIRVHRGSSVVSN